MKSQSYIIEYILFFVIGMSLFSAIVSFLSYLSPSFSESVSVPIKNMIADYLVNNIADLVLLCKYCNVSSIYVSLPSKPRVEFPELLGGYEIVIGEYEIILDNRNINSLLFSFRMLRFGKESLINVKNLNYTYTFFVKIAPENLPRFLITYYSYNKTIIRV